MFYRTNVKIFESHIKNCMNLLYYTTGIPVSIYNSTYELKEELGQISLYDNDFLGPFKKTSLFDPHIVNNQIDLSNSKNTTYSYTNPLLFHYFIRTYYDGENMLGILVMGPMTTADYESINPLAFMSKHHLSISEFNNYISSYKRLPKIDPIQTQYYIQLINLISANDFNSPMNPIIESTSTPITYQSLGLPERFHHSYALEKRLGQSLFSDDTQQLKELAEEFSTYPRPVLAPNNPLRSNQNYFISTATVFTRFAIEAGLNSETAFSYCDYFINQVEQCRDINSVEALTIRMISTFKTLVKENERMTYSSPVSLAKVYIDTHLSGNISLSDVAKAIGYSSKYLSEVFVKDTGITFKNYINEKKLEMAKSLLLNPKNSILDVCNYLGYCNQSYFSKIFKEYSGLSPSKFIKCHR